MHICIDIIYISTTLRRHDEGVAKMLRRRCEGVAKTSPRHCEGVAKIFTWAIHFHLVAFN